MAAAASETVKAPSATPRPLDGRTAIITGSSRGIGRAVAVHLASLGAKVVVNYASNSSQADLVADQINSVAPNSAIAVQADVSDPSQVRSLFDEAEKAFNSPVYVMVNSAGVADSAHSTIAETPVEDFDKIFR